MIRVAGVILLLCACSGAPTEDDADPGTLDGGSDANGIPDANGGPDAVGGPDAIVFDPGEEPTEVVRPEPGEVTVIQLALLADITVSMAEAAIVVGPDGTIALIDLGNAIQDDEVRAAIVELNTTYLTPANGFPARSPRQVEWIVVTHIHGDHVGAFEDLMVDTAEPLQVTGGIVHRGFVDIGAGLNEADYEEFCTAMRGTYADLDLPLCQAANPAPCTVAEAVEPHRATDCPGLFLGDLGDAGDDGAGQPSFIPLGGGARITLVAADAFVSNGTSAVAMAPFDHADTNEENARSVAGILGFGNFRYHFGGDMTGTGDSGEPDVESHLVAVAGPTFYGDLGVDVIHTHHHARHTSSNATFIAAMAPSDGLSRNPVAGINQAHLGSPHQDVLDAWAGSGRLADGRFWVTMTTLTSGTHSALVDAAGPVIVQTIQSGVGYRVQAAGADLFSLAFPSVRFAAR